MSTLLLTELTHLEQLLGAGQDQLLEQLFCAAQISNVCCTLRLRRSKGLAPTVGQTILVMSQEQVHSPVVGDRDLNQIINHLFSEATTMFVAERSARPIVGINQGTPGQTTRHRMGDTGPSSVDAANNRTMVNPMTQIPSSLLNLPFAYRRLAPVKKENILWTKNKKMSIDIFLCNTYFKIFYSKIV